MLPRSKRECIFSPISDIKDSKYKFIIKIPKSILSFTYLHQTHWSYSSYYLSIRGGSDARGRTLKDDPAASTTNTETWHVYCQCLGLLCSLLPFCEVNRAYRRYQLNFNLVYSELQTIKLPQNSNYPLQNNVLRQLMNRINFRNALSCVCAICIHRIVILNSELPKTRAQQSSCAMCVLNAAQLHSVHKKLEITLYLAFL